MKLKVLFLILIIPALATVAIMVSRKGQHSQVENLHHHEADQPAQRAMVPMSTRHMDMSAHMKMTKPTKVKSNDEERAEAIAKTARQAIEKFKDYRVALEEGYQILLPDVPQNMYHFNNIVYGMEAQQQFNPVHPTSLLYEKTADGYRLIGVMYTAPANLTEKELDQRIPISIAQWHQHVNICIPPGEMDERLLSADSQFGINGSITTKEECEQAGGRFLPRLFGWMVHLYPYEQTAQEMWSVERQLTDEPHHAD